MRERQLLARVVLAAVTLISTAALAQTQIDVSGAHGGAVVFTYDGGKSATTVGPQGSVAHSLSSGGLGFDNSAGMSSVSAAVAVAPVPEPGTLAMLGSGLLATGSVFRLRRRK